MSQYHIQPDPKLPDDEEIRASMNFNAVYDRYAASHQRHWWQRLRLRPRLFAGVTLVFAVCLLVYEAVQEEEQAEKTAKRAAFLLDQVTSGGELRHAVAKDTHFIRAFRKNMYDLPTFQLPDSQVFNISFYDPERKIWVEKGLLQPRVSVHKIFKLDVLSSEFPELDSVRDLHWQHISGPDIDTLLRQTWDRVSVDRRQHHTYALFLTKGSNSELIIARPVSGQGRREHREYWYSLMVERAGIYQLVPQRAGK